MEQNVKIVKSAAKNLASQVRQMRMLQKEYFQTSHGDATKPGKLQAAQAQERKVDGVLLKFDATIDAH